jgi:hypothetical protein
MIDTRIYDSWKPKSQRTTDFCFLGIGFTTADSPLPAFSRAISHLPIFLYGFLTGIMGSTIIHLTGGAFLTQKEKNES